MVSKSANPSASNFESLSPAQVDLVLSLNSLRSRLLVSLPIGEKGEFYKSRVSSLFDLVRTIAVCSPNGGSRKAKACVDLLIADWTKVEVAIDFVEKAAPFSVKASEDEWIGIFGRASRCKPTSTSISPLAVALSVLRAQMPESGGPNMDSMARIAARDESALSTEIRKLQSDLIAMPPLDMPIRTETPAVPMSLMHYQRQLDLQALNRKR